MRRAISQVIHQEINLLITGRAAEIVLLVEAAEIDEFVAGSLFEEAG